MSTPFKYVLQMVKERPVRGKGKRKRTPSVSDVEEPETKLFVFSQDEIVELTQNITRNAVEHIWSYMGITPKEQGNNVPLPQSAKKDNTDNPIPSCSNANDGASEKDNVTSNEQSANPAISPEMLLSYYNTLGANAVSSISANTTETLPIYNASGRVTKEMLSSSLGFINSNIPQQSPCIQKGTAPSASCNPTAQDYNAPLPQNDIFTPNGTSDNLNSAILDLLGKKEHTYDLPSTSIDRGINDAMRLKIWNNSYVNFLDLVIRHDLYSNQNQTGSTPRGGKINSFSLWQKAFNIYHAIYVQRYPELSAALCQYSEFIRELHFKAPNTYAWRSYDETFRFQRQSDNRPWGQIDMELWVRLTTLSKFNTQSTSQNSGYSTFSKGKNYQKSSSYNSKGSFKNSSIYDKCIENGICFKFSHLDNCKFENCKYKHICYACQGKHSVKNCTSSASSTKDKGSPKKS